MKVKVLYFGRFAVEIGKFHEVVEIDNNATVKDLISLLREKYPFLKDETVEVSIGGKYAKDDDSIAQEVSVFPLISGG